MPYDAPDQPPVATPDDVDAAVGPLREQLADLQRQLAELPASAPTPAPTAPAADRSRVRRPLDSFAGPNDDERLAAFVSYASQQTYRGVVCELDASREHVFTRPVDLYDGFGLTTSANRAVDQGRGSKPISNLVRLNLAGGLLRLVKPQTFGVHIAGLSFDGSSQARLVEGHPSNVLWTSTFRDLAAQNLGGMFGSKAQKLLNTACNWDGWWNVNNVREQAFHIGGSDSRLDARILLDSPPSLLGDREFLANFDYQYKTAIANWYVTAERHSAFNVYGGRMLRMHDMEIEGRNAGAPCYGALIRSAGFLQLRSSWTSYAMANPSATGRDDQGVIHSSGGVLEVLDTHYERANGVDESVPYIYASAGKVVVRNVNGVGFSGKPVVKVARGVTVDADASVQVITAA